MATNMDNPVAIEDLWAWAVIYEVADAVKELRGGDKPDMSPQRAWDLLFRRDLAGARRA